MYLATILDHRPSTVLEPLTLKVGSLEEGTLRTSQAYLSWQDLVTDRSRIPKSHVRYLIGAQTVLRTGVTVISKQL